MGGCLRLGESDESTNTTRTPPTRTQMSTSAPTTRRATDFTVRDTETAAESQQTASETQTEAQSETQTPAPAYPPGLGSNGPSEFLLDNHLNNLLTTSFTMTNTRENITESNIMDDTEVRYQSGRALQFERARRPYVDKFIVPNESRITWRTEIDREQAYGDVYRSGQSRVRELIEAGKDRFSLLYWAVQGGSYEEPIWDPDDEVFRITANALEDADLVRSVFRTDSIEQFTASGTVSPEGIVRSLEVDVDIIRDGTLVNVNTEYRISDIGETSVTANWVSIARNEAPEIEASVEDNRQYLVMENIGAQPTIPKTVLYLKDQSKSLDTQIPTGSSLYAAIDQNSNLRVEIGSRPDVTDPVSLDSGTLALSLQPISAVYYSGSLDSI